MTRIKAKKNPNLSPEANELITFATNDQHLYRTSYLPILQNLARKIKKGVYDKTKAKKLWLYHADRAAKAYAKEFGETKDWNVIFPIAVRLEAASYWVADTENAIGEHDILESMDMKKNPRRKRGESKICHKAKRLVKRKKTRPQAKALFAEAARQGKPCKRRTRSSSKAVARKRRKHSVINARKNPYMPYVVYGDERPRRAQPGHPKRFYWDGMKFTTDKKFAEHFPNAESASNTAKRLFKNIQKPNSPAGKRLEFIAIQRAK